MSRQSLEEEIPASELILLDSSCVIAYLNGNEIVTPVATAIIDEFVRSGRNSAVISMVTVMEVLVRPLQAGSEEYMRALGFLTSFPNLSRVSIDYRVTLQAASLRARLGLKSPDALVVATAVVAGARFLVTNDAGWLRLGRVELEKLRVCSLQAHLPFT